MYNLAPMKNCPGGARQPKFDTNFSTLGKSRTLDMIEFECLTPVLENHIRGGHGNHAFHIAHTKIF